VRRGFTKSLTRLLLPLIHSLLLLPLVLRKYNTVCHSPPYYNDELIVVFLILLVSPVSTRVNVDGDAAISL